MNTFIGIPEKGRNAGIALEKELPDSVDTQHVLDILNGSGKHYAKTGENQEFIQNEVEQLDFIETKHTGREYPRPVFTEIQLTDKEVTSFEENQVLQNDFQRLYRGLDRLVETNYDPCEIEANSFQNLGRRLAAENGYEITETYGDEVKWTAMNTNLEQEPDTFLYPEEFEKISRAVQKEVYEEAEPDYLTFDEYIDQNNLEKGIDEEEILAETQDNVAGAYMYVSGGTADDYNLEFNKLPGFTSRLARFEKI